MPTAPNRNSTGRILILDDNALGRMARGGVLSELGHEIVTCSAPRDALVLCSQQNFDLVVTDYKMPSMNGVEFIKQLRSIRANTPVILVSAFTDALGLSEANTGADAVIQKSSNEVSHLIRCVNRLLKKSAEKKPAASQGSSKNVAKRKRAE